MMKVELLHDTVVRFKKGDVIEVSEAEGKRLIAFTNAKEATEEKETRKRRAAK